MLPAQSGSAGRRGERDRLVNRCQAGQRIRLDLQLAHLVDESVDVGGHAFGLHVVEQPHRRVEPVVGGTAVRRVENGLHLPRIGHMARFPCRLKRVLGRLRRQGAEVVGNLPHNAPQQIEIAHVFVMVSAQRLEHIEQRLVITLRKEQI